MKTQLFLALALTVLAANTYAADGSDKTGTADFISGATASVEHTRSSAVASDGFDHTGTAGAIAADGFDKTGTAGAIG
ncbi:hypothetical protein [Pseudomonas frederiksbergensis]|uniref:Heme utilization protein n=1 Tax=Pseudomonas frederiksbergensis TaxID=104087 RepID=A0A423KAG1_9PSED|nr:hypothetical protein [Pseudomonas frederiksbergensis]RON49053.1 hypothetical protein BK665_23815 [Pseudomonas frederiksbergensis]